MDCKARRLTERFAAGILREVHSGAGGRCRRQLGDGVVVEVMPAYAGLVEQWRLFDRDTDRHVVYRDYADN